MKQKFIYRAILFMLLLVAFTQVIQAGTSKFFIKEKEMPGWATTESGVLKKDKDIKKLLGESYKEYTGYGLKEILYQEISTPDYRMIRIEIFITRDKPGARGIFRRFKALEYAAFGNEGSESPGYLSFYRDNYFVKVVAKRKTMEGNPFLKQVAKIIDDKISK